MCLNGVTPRLIAPLAPVSRQLWIEATQAAGVDPREVLLHHLEDILAAIYQGTQVCYRSPCFLLHY